MTLLCGGELNEIPTLKSEEIEIERLDEWEMRILKGS